MADDSAMETIGIVGALHTSGLLQSRDSVQTRDTAHKVHNPGCSSSPWCWR
jgi:hypothetical protein